MTTALVPISDIEKMATAVAKSGLFGVKSQEQAFALMLVAQAEGLHPAIAARDYHVINGRPTLKADAMLARFQAAGGKVSWKELTDKKATATFTHAQGGSVEITWSIDMAVSAGLLKNPTWKSYPRSMLRARCVSEGIRTVFPGVVAGYYTPEEIEDFPEQEPKDITPAQTETATKPKKSSRLSAVIDAQPEAIDGEIIEHDIAPDLSAMRECDDLASLQEVFAAAWKQTPADMRDALKSVYEECKAKLSSPPLEGEVMDENEEAPV